MTGKCTSRRAFLESAGIAGLALTVARPSVAGMVRHGSAKQPNIVFIMTDDMGYADLSCYGAVGYKTPALDRLAAEGVRFDQAYANAPICSPTRTALVTGRYQGRYKAGLAEPNTRFEPGDQLPLSTATVASLLKRAGYRTAFVGKWHVCKVPEYSPLRYGYDSFFGIPAGAADYFSYDAKYGGRRSGDGLYNGDERVERHGYLTDILADEAIRQIKAGGEQPLFLSLHFNAPHWPWEGPEDTARINDYDALNDLAGGSLETYAKMMTNMDANVGRVLAALRSAGMEKDTIVVFTSDNGGERYSNTWPLVGYKGELLEGGIRVPMIVRWPGHIQPGSRCDQVAISMDTVPTFLAAAGAVIPPELEGMNLLPQLLGGTKTDRTLYWRMKAANQAAVREGNWKYVRIGDKEMLFDIAKDPRERAQLQGRHPEILATLKSKWEAWNATMLPYPANSPSEATVSIYGDRY